MATLSGTGGNDSLVGGEGADTITGDAGQDTLVGGGGSDSIEGGNASDLIAGDSFAPIGGSAGVERISNGNFDGDSLDGWTLNNPTGDQGPTSYAGIAALNAGNEEVYGDSIEQDITTPVGVSHSATMRLSANGGGTHTFRVDILDSEGNVIATEVYEASAAAPLNIELNFVPTTIETTLRITNTDATNSLGSDALIDNVSVMSAAPGDDTIDGAAGNDTIYGGEGDDLIIGGDGQDIVHGGSGNDTIMGDGVTGNGESDTIYGGAGDDYIDAGDFDDELVFGGSGNDTILDTNTDTFGDDAGTLHGGAGDDLFVASNGQSSQNTIFGGVGNDTVEAEEKSEFIDGGVGEDSLAGGDGADTITGGADNDTIDGGDGADFIQGDGIVSVGEGELIANGDFGSGTLDSWTIGNPSGGTPPLAVAGGVDFSGGTETSFGDSISQQIGTVQGAAYTVSANLRTLGITQGTHTIRIDILNTENIIIATETETVTTGSSNKIDFDFVAGSASTIRITHVDATNTVNSDAIVDNISVVPSQPGDDSIAGGTGEDTIFGNFGDDTIDGGADNDFIQAGQGNDSIIGGVGDDTIFGNDGADTIMGDAGLDSIMGGEGNDSIDGGSGSDAISGGADNDTIIGGSGNDSIDGDLAGTEILTNGDFDSGTLTGWTAQNPSGAPQPSAVAGGVAFGGGDTASAGASIQQTVDTITGDLYEVSLDLRTLGATQGTHTIRVDILDNTGDVIATQTNSVTTNTTNDIAFSFDAVSDTSTIVVTHTNSTNTVNSDVIVDNVSILSVAVGDDSIDGGIGNDTINGQHGEDMIDGGAGDDLLSGGAGNDILSGGAGVDTINGDQGSDTLYYGEGDEVLSDGGEGNDTIIGGAGNDTLTISALPTFSDVLDGGEGLDADAADDGTADGDIDVLDLSGLRPGVDYTIAYDAVGGDVQAADDADSGSAFQTSENGTVTFSNGETLTFSNIESVICFAAGTKITAAQGDIAIEDLEQGDKVLTVDNGYQTLRWIGSRSMSKADLKNAPKLQPIRIRAGALGVNTPSEDLLVSPQHRMLVRSRIAQRMFNEGEVLVAAKHLVTIDGVDVARDCDEIRYLHMLFDRHELVRANGALSESLFTGPEAIRSIDPELRHEIFTLFPALLDVNYEALSCRKLSTGRMGRKLAIRHQNNLKALYSNNI